MSSIAYEKELSQLQKAREFLDSQRGQELCWSNFEELIDHYENLLSSSMRLNRINDRMELSLSRSRIKANQANEAKSLFLANMSHELRTPMTAILGMLHLALNTELSEQQRGYLTKTHTAAENLLRILNDILDFSKVDAGKLELDEHTFLLKDIFSALTNTVQLRADEKNIDLIINIDKSIPNLLYGDSLRLGQVLINLVNNAIKFSHEDSQVKVLVTLEKVEQDIYNIKFAIVDSGIGISQEDQKKLFHAFSQADSSITRQYGGTGLGLVICKKLIELMQGKIELESKLGEGSSFYFTLPFKNNNQIQSGESNQDLALDGDQLMKLNNSRVLLTEDDEINQELVTELLEDEGVIVTTASNGQIALDLLESENFDVVLMDCQMPVLDGFEATKKIRENAKFSDLPVIALTANVMQSDINQVLEVGMNDHVCKPIDPPTLFATIAKWIK